MSHPHYSPGGHWMPSVPGQICRVCEKQYTAHRVNQKFCSRKCAGLARRLPTSLRGKSCLHCGKTFEIPAGQNASGSHAAKYCSRECVRAHHGWSQARRVSCANCGKPLDASARDASQRFCSTACLSVYRRSRRVTKTCLNCGKMFTVSRARSDEMLCSRACSTSYYVRDRSPGWQGGVVKQNGRMFRRIDREGYAAKYDGDHRLVAERTIGRRLKRNEVVICLDGNNDNHAPANLFLLPNQKEFGLLKAGSVPWPAESNLRSYRDRGYSRPDVIVVLHEWENDRRQNAESKRYITRHPHADEIIKRRRAGASVRQLAKDFGTSMSTMAQTIRNRL